MLNNKIVELFRAVDTSDWGELEKLFHREIVYERPGYLTINGIERLLHFYRFERVLASGQHQVEHIVFEGNNGACWGRFVGYKKDGTHVNEPFADVYCFEDGKIKTRRSYFFQPAV